MGDYYIKQSSLHTWITLGSIWSALENQFSFNPIPHRSSTCKIKVLKFHKIENSNKFKLNTTRHGINDLNSRIKCCHQHKYCFNFKKLLKINENLTNWRHWTKIQTFNCVLETLPLGSTWASSPSLSLHCNPLPLWPDPANTHLIVWFKLQKGLFKTQSKPLNTILSYNSNNIHINQ